MSNQTVLKTVTCVDYAITAKICRQRTQTYGVTLMLQLDEHEGLDRKICH